MLYLIHLFTRRFNLDTVSDLSEAPLYDINNDILLLGSDLIVAGQTYTSVKDIRAYIHRAVFGYISVASRSAAAVNGDERVRAVYGLHMHRLPDWAAFCVQKCMS